MPVLSRAWFCFYKATNGIERHLAVDILGFPFFTHCTKASLSDDRGLNLCYRDRIDYFKSKPAELPYFTSVGACTFSDKKIPTCGLTCCNMCCRTACSIPSRVLKDSDFEIDRFGYH